MAEEKEPAGEKAFEPGRAEQVGKKGARPKFNMPFIVAGILIGIFAGAPLLDVGNYLFGLWGWVFGILAVYLFSKQFKYFNAPQAGIVGLFAGIIGSVISVAGHILLSVGEFSLDRILPANLIAQISKFTTFLSTLWIPEQLRNTFSVKPFSLLQAEFREAVRMADPNACSPMKYFVGHALFLTGLISITAILGGLIGYCLFAIPVPQKVKDMRYVQYGRRPPVRRTGEGGPPPLSDKPPREAGADEKGEDQAEK
jgi:hypothetical protein